MANRSAVIRWIERQTETEAALPLWERTGMLEAHRPGQGRAGAEYTLEQAVSAMLVTVTRDAIGAEMAKELAPGLRQMGRIGNVGPDSRVLLTNHGARVFSNLRETGDFVRASWKYPERGIHVYGNLPVGRYVASACKEFPEFRRRNDE